MSSAPPPSHDTTTTTTTQHTSDDVLNGSGNDVTSHSNKRKEPPQSTPSDSESDSEFALRVSNIDKFLPPGKFKKRVKKLELPGLKSFSKQFKKPTALFKFKDAESREAAISILQEQEDKRSGKWATEIITNLPPPKKKQRTQDSRPKSIIEKVTPLAHLSYEDQLLEKEGEVLGVMTNISKTLQKLWVQKPGTPIPEYMSLRPNPSLQPTGSDDNDDNPRLAKEKTLKRKTSRLPFEWCGIRGSPATQGYRNKCEFTFGLNTEQQPALGFVLARNGDDVVVEAPFACAHVSDVSKSVVKVLERFIQTEYREDVHVWSRADEKRFWRLAMVRHNQQNEVLVMLQVDPSSPAISQETRIQVQQSIAKYLKKAQNAGEICDDGKIAGVLWQEYSGVSTPSPGECPVQLVDGQATIIENILGCKFRVSAESFLQTNTRGAEVLYAIAREWAGLNVDDDDAEKGNAPLQESSDTQSPPVLLLDICCGTGTMGIIMSSAVSSVIGVEMMASAVEDAQANAELNDVSNIRFVCGKAEDVLKKELQNIPSNVKVVAIVDPPRPGLHVDVLKSLLTFSRIDHLVYVSCNPKSLADNAITLCKPPNKLMRNENVNMFQPVRALAVDMFPHTKHCESVMLFTRQSKE